MEPAQFFNLKTFCSVCRKLIRRRQRAHHFTYFSKGNNQDLHTWICIGCVEQFKKPVVFEDQEHGAIIIEMEGVDL